MTPTGREQKLDADAKPLDLCEGDTSPVSVYFADGGRLLDQTVDRVAKSAAMDAFVRQFREKTDDQIDRAFKAITEWSKNQPDVKSVHAALHGTMQTKFRVLIITRGEYFDESVAESVDELSSQVIDLLDGLPFQFRFYVQPESTEEAAFRTFIGPRDTEESDESGS